MNMQFFQPQLPDHSAALLKLLQESNTPTFDSAAMLPAQVLAYQTMMMKVRALKMIQMKNYLQHNLLNLSNLNIINLDNQIPMPAKINFEAAAVKVESPSTGSETSVRSEIAQYQHQPQPQPQSNALTFGKTNLEGCLKTELDKIVTFLLNNMGKNNQAAIENFRKFYLNNACLLQVFDKLVMKYYSAKKCKEDIVRYILRKTFKVIRTSIMKKERVCSKKASLILCKKYFKNNFDQIQESGVNIENEEEVLELFMPYRKKSKNKTMNTSFVLEVFSSEDFCQEYQTFLAEFGNILQADNNKKKEKFLNFLMDCVKKNSISKIGSFNRLPWLDVWMEDTTNIANGLIPNKNLLSSYKKTKNDDTGLPQSL